MADEKEIPRTKRVFINHIDSYSSKYIAKFLSTCIVGETLDETVNQEEKPSENEPTFENGTFQIVGTVANKEEFNHHSEFYENNLSFALEEYSSLTRDELMQRLMECDVIVYNITENADEIDEATWAISALHSEIENFGFPKIFILVSTLMTWAMSKPADPDDPEIPLTEDDFRRKRPHQNFREHASAEKLVLKLGKTKKSKLSTYVVASGLQYGMGEDIFHYFFKVSWLGEVTRVPIIGPGTNVIPTIHVNDLAGVVQSIIDHKPKTHYFIAVDESKNTLEDIVKAVTDRIGPGNTKKVTREEAYLTNTLPQADLDYLSINLRIEPALLKDCFNLHWVCEFGIVDNILRVVEEYKQCRQLLPIRICLLGAPAVGKSSIAEKLCKHYKLHHIKVKDAISERLKDLEEMLQSDDRENETEETLQGAQDLLDSLKDSIYQNEGQLDDQHVRRIIRDKLNSTPCQNQGFVLDGYPKSYEDAKELFYDDDMEMDDIRSKMLPHNKKIIPECIFSLDATDEFLKERVWNLPESIAEEMHYTQDEYLHRLAEFREADAVDETVLNYFDELEIHPEHIDINDADDSENLAVIEKIIKVVGMPRNYGLTPEEQAEEKRRSAGEMQQRLLQETAERGLREVEEAAKMAAQLDEWNRHVAEVKKQEHELLEVRSVPMRNYLMKYVMPTLAQGMIECCKAKPEDPVDFLAEYLFKNSSEDE